MEKISKVLVVGGGTAGLISALTLRLKVPGVSVTVIRSKEMGVIGVGEGTIGSFGAFFLILTTSKFYLKNE